MLCRGNLLVVGLVPLDNLLDSRHHRSEHVLEEHGRVLLSVSRSDDRRVGHIALDRLELCAGEQLVSPVGDRQRYQSVLDLVLGRGKETNPLLNRRCRRGPP